MYRKLLFVIDNLGSGGAQNQLTLLASLFKKNNDDVTVFVYNDSDFFKYRLDTLNIPIVYSKKKTKSGWEVIKALGRLMKTQSFDAVISFLQTPNFYTSVSKKINSLPVPLLISERFISFENKSSIKYWMKRYAHLIASHATTNSHHERRRIIDKGLTKSSAISTIYNLVDLDYFHFNVKKERSFKLLSVASVSPYKNGMCLVDALIKLKERNKLNFSVTWVGSKVHTIAERKEYILKMENAIVENDLSNHWNWVEPQRDIRSFYHSHDALVHPSYREGLPNVICEALSCGMPVIASDILDHPILLDKGKNGFLFDHTSPEELADQIVRFYELSEYRISTIRNNSRAFAEASFSEERFFNSYSDIITQMIISD